MTKTISMAFGILMVSLLASAAIVFAQSPSPTAGQTVSPTATTAPSVTPTRTPAPTGATTVPQGAPATGFGGGY